MDFHYFNRGDCMQFSFKRLDYSAKKTVKVVGWGFGWFFNTFLVIFADDAGMIALRGDMVAYILL